MVETNTALLWVPEVKIDETGVEYIEWCFERGTKTRNSEVAGCSGSQTFKPEMHEPSNLRCMQQAVVVVAQFVTTKCNYHMYM